MATITFGAVAGNWSDNTKWVGGVKPADGDDVIFNSESADCSVNENTAKLKSLDMTDYVGTLSNSYTMHIRGATASTNVCKLAGTFNFSGNLIFDPESTTAIINLTTNGKLLSFISIAPWYGATSLIVLQDDLSFTATKNNVLTLYLQGLDLNGHTISGNSSINRLLIKSVTLGTAVALTVNGGTFANCDFRDINFANGGVNLDLSAITGGSGDCGGNGMSGGGTLTLTTADDWYWQTTGAGTYNFSDATYWFTATNGGGDSGDVRGFPPLPQDNCYFDADSITGSTTVDQDMPRMCKTLDFTGVDAVAFHMNNLNQTIYGSLIFVNNVTLTTSSYLDPYFEGRGSFTFTSSGKQFGNIRIQMIGGTLAFQDNVTVIYYIYLTNGTLTTNSNVTAQQFISNVTTARSISMGSGTWTLSYPYAGGYAWELGTTAPTSFNAGTSTIIIGHATAGCGFRGAGQTYNNLTIITGTGADTIVGSNTFNTFTINAPKTVKFTDGTDTTVSSFVATGTGANAITITGTSTAGYKLSDTTGTNTVHYCTIDYATCEGGATWDATDHCTDGGHNSAPDSGLTGWLFISAPTTAPYRAQKGLICGYNCFIKQYVDFTKAGLAPLKLPDGTLW